MRSSSIANLALLWHVLVVPIEIVGQLLCFFKGTRPMPPDLLLCLCLLANDWVRIYSNMRFLLFTSIYAVDFANPPCCYDFLCMQFLAVFTYGAAIGTVAITVEMHKTGRIVPWVETNLVYGVLGTLSGIRATASAICQMSIAARDGGPLQFHELQFHEE